MENSSDINVIVFTINEDNKKLFEQIVSVDSLYRTETMLPKEIFDAIKDNVETDLTIKDDTTKKLVILLKNLDLDKNNVPNTDEEKQKILTERENEVLTALALGNRYKQIAEMLYLSVHTIRFHMKSIYHKFNIHSHSEAIAIAMQRGLI